LSKPNTTPIQEGAATSDHWLTIALALRFLPSSHVMDMFGIPDVIKTIRRYYPQVHAAYFRGDHAKSGTCVYCTRNLINALYRDGAIRFGDSEIPSIYP